MENDTMSDILLNDDIEYLCDEVFNFTFISSAFFILVFIFSIAGNGLLLRILIIYENLKNVTNLFVLNLACSDLIFTLTLPFWTTSLLHHWVFGDFGCKFLIATYFVGVYSSIILLTAMTVDRFIMVVLQKWPSICVRRQRFAMAACAASWIISVAASLSDAVKVKAETHFNNLTTCQLSYDDMDNKLGYHLQVSLLFFLPLVIMIFCYSAILRRVLMASNRKNHKTIGVVLCIVVAFFICWGPYNILLMIEAYYTPADCIASERLDIAFHICQILAFSHCCMNPLLYMLSHKLRKHLLNLLAHCVVRKRIVRVQSTATVMFTRKTSVSSQNPHMETFVC